MSMSLHTIMEIAGQLGYSVQLDNGSFIIMLGDTEIEYGLSHTELLESLLCMASDQLDNATTDLSAADQEIAYLNESRRGYQERCQELAAQVRDDHSWLDDIAARKLADRIQTIHELTNSEKLDYFIANNL